MALTDKPTRQQLSYLRRLATSRGQSFAYPQTRGDASREIQRLKALRPDRPSDIRRERRELHAAMATERGDAAQVRPGETTGYGSNARWKRDEPAASSERALPTKPPSGTVGKRRELGRYELSSGERVIYGQRINGAVRVTDRPASGDGRSYLVERELHSNAELEALIADYLDQTSRRDAIPCHVHW